MILNVLLGILVAYFISTMFFFYVAAYSLEYHSAVGRPSPDAIKAFLNNLYPPIKQLFIGDNPVLGKVLTGKNSESLIEYLQHPNQTRAQAYRIFFSFPPTFLIVANLIGLTKSNGWGFLSNAALVMLLSVSIFYCWRFGYQLQSNRDSERNE